MIIESHSHDAVARRDGHSRIRWLAFAVRQRALIMFVTECSFVLCAAEAATLPPTTSAPRTLEHGRNIESLLS